MFQTSSFLTFPELKEELVKAGARSNNYLIKGRYKYCLSDSGERFIHRFPVKGD